MLETDGIIEQCECTFFQGKTSDCTTAAKYSLPIFKTCFCLYFATAHAPKVRCMVEFFYLTAKQVIKLEWPHHESGVFEV